MNNSKIILKIFIMNSLFFVSEIWKLFNKRELKNPKKIAILFLKNLGIGDLVMLSPAIQKISEIFPNSEIVLISWIPKIIEFKNISWISDIEFKKRKKEFDLIISPTLCLRHWKYIFSSKYWIGYFSIPKIQSNFSNKRYRYNLTKEHYLLRGIYLIKALNKKKGEEMEKQAEEKRIEYPDLILKEPEYFKKKLLNKRYLAIAPVSKWKDRQISIEKFSEICEYLYNNKKVEKIVFLGDKSDWDFNFITKIISQLKDISEKDILNTVGKNTLPESIFLIKNSEIFIGLDSAPAHFAYLLAKRTLAIFINVNPQWRKPLNISLGKISCLYPEDSNYACYTGLGPADKKKCKELSNSITIDKMKEEIDKLFQ
jgi:ADP-heptose:LPS heptosyltransferase